MNLPDTATNSPTLPPHRYEPRTGQATMTDVKEDIVQLKHDVSEAAGDLAHSGIDAVKSGAAQAADAGRKVADAARSGHGKMCEYVSQNPTTAVLIAVGVGALFASILPRR